MAPMLLCSTAMSDLSTTPPCAPCAEPRDQRILQHLPLVHRIARRLRARLPADVPLDNLVGAGTLGLVLAAEAYAGERGVPFEAFARWRIHGAMLDFLRGEDPLARTARRRLRDSKKESEAPRFVDIDELADRLALDRSDADLASDGWLRARLRKSWEDLGENERTLLALYYGEARTMREVGARLGVSEARICQRLGEVISRLRSSMLRTG